MCTPEKLTFFKLKMAAAMFRTIKRKCYLFFTILLLKRLMYTNSQISGSWNSI